MGLGARRVFGEDLDDIPWFEILGWFVVHSERFYTKMGLNVNQLVWPPAILHPRFRSRVSSLGVFWIPNGTGILRGELS